MDPVVRWYVLLNVEAMRNTDVALATDSIRAKMRNYIARRSGASFALVQVKAERVATGIARGDLSKRALY